MKLILILVSIIKKIQVDKIGQQYILCRIDIYFTKYCLAIDLIFEEKRQKALEKNLTVHLLELILVKKILMQTMKLVKYKHLLVNLKTIK